MNVVGLILGGGAGTRLQPLTRERSKPAVPVAGKFRLVDIPISNCINSGIRNIFLLTQYNSVSLHQHIAATYRFDQFSGGHVRVLAAEQTPDSDIWFQGTADAVRRSMRYFKDDQPDLVVILSGDQLYRMNVQEVIDTHLKSGAEITVSTTPVDREAARSLGIMQVSDQGQVVKFVEKPAEDAVLDGLVVSDRSETFLASMGIYVFNMEVLASFLEQNDQSDFGKHIIPEAIHSHRVFSHVFEGYWEDIGTIRSFWAANLALTEPLPRFSFYDTDQLIYTRMRYLPPSKINSCELVQSLISDGCILSGERIWRSVVGLRSIVGEDSVVEESILMGADFYEQHVESDTNQIALGIGKNCTIQKAILDKNVRIGDGVVITPEGKPSEMDDDLFCIREGIVVIPKNTVIPDGTHI
jgi:glucose-1-phosphate adenylyltransferase